MTGTKRNDRSCHGKAVRYLMPVQINAHGGIADAKEESDVDSEVDTGYLRRRV